MEHGLRAPGLRPVRGDGETDAALAANQGLYNLFLVVGLAWGLSFGPSGELTRLIFLGFIAIAGIFGGVTVGWRVFLIQGVPGLLALAATWYRI